MNAATSAVAGLVAAIAPGPVSELLGMTHDRSDLIVRVVGFGLAVFAFEVALTATRYQKATIARDVALISTADIAWVISTVVVLATVDLSTTGRVVASVMGVGVAAFATLQLRLRHRSTSQTNNQTEKQP